MLVRVTRAACIPTLLQPATGKTLLPKNLSLLLTVITALFQWLASRELAGHSMGGYGTMRIGEKYPEIFSSIYLLSPCCLTPNFNIPQTPEVISKIEAVKSYADFEKADFPTKATFASAAAWSPDPANPPFYLQLPVKDGQLQHGVQ